MRPSACEVVADQGLQQRDSISTHSKETILADDNPSQTIPTAGESHSKITAHRRTKSRLRKACDACSTRKVKCDEQGPPCSSCEGLGIPCTFERPSRRRGPPNRHAEAIKRRHLHNSSDNLEETDARDNVVCNTRTDKILFSAEMICPLPLIWLLVDDYFIYIHPLVPLPHEPTFREALSRRADTKDRKFLALLAGMIGTLVVSFPRQPQLHFKNQEPQKLFRLFPNYMTLVNKCQEVAIEARGAGYLDRELSIDDATTSYLLGLTHAYAFRWRQSKLYLGECLNMVRAMGLHRKRTVNPTYQQDTSSMALAADTDGFVSQELGKRLFWVLFVGMLSIHHLGASSSDLSITPESRLEPYPSLPLEVDDEYISCGEIAPQPPDIVSELVGFNANVRVYRSCISLTDFHPFVDLKEPIHWELHLQKLLSCLGDCKHALDHVPADLLLQSTGHHYRALPDSEMSESTDPRSKAKQYRPGRISHRRKLQYEIQKANIYVSQLSTRSQIVERYWALHDHFQNHLSIQRSISEAPTMNSTQPQSRGASADLDHCGSRIQFEREEIVQDLLQVLDNISQISMEPNGASFINKIRQIASTLLHPSAGSEGALATRSREYLMTLVELLMKLERVPPTPPRGGFEQDGVDLDMSSTSPATETPWATVDEETELQNWADLREHQTRFVESGGVLNNL